MLYKINNINRDKYIWNNIFMDYGTLKISNIREIQQKQKTPYVYDIEVEDNHNFIIENAFSNNQENYMRWTNCFKLSSYFIRGFLSFITKSFI